MKNESKSNRLQKLLTTVFDPPPPAPTPGQGLITAYQLAARLGMSEFTIKKWARQGLIPVVHIRSRLRFDYSAVLVALALSYVSSKKKEV